MVGGVFLAHQKPMVCPACGFDGIKRVGSRNCHYYECSQCGYKIPRIKQEINRKLKWR
jgi:Zn ribbon nucleic-acid-binding protein